MFPPMLVYLRLSKPDKSRMGLWLPLFLVWLLLLPIILLAVLLAMLVDVALVLSGRDFHSYTRLLLHLLGVLGTARGTVLSIHSEDNVIDVKLV